MIDAFLINSMPYAIFLKTIVFALLWITLFLQAPSTRLGLWINIFFFLTSLTSFTVANYVWYVNDLRQPPALHNTREWILAIFMNLLPFLTSLSGIMVTQYTHRAESILQQNTREEHDHPEHVVRS